MRKRFWLKVPLRLLGRENKLFIERHNQDSLAPEEAVELRHSQITRIIRPNETWITTFNVGTTSDTKQPRGRVAHSNLNSGIDLRHTLSIWRLSAIGPPPNGKIVGPLFFRHGGAPHFGFAR